MSIDWHDFVDQEALDKFNRPRGKTRKTPLSKWRARDGGHPSPEGTKRTIKKNKKNSPSKTTFCWRTKRGIFGTRCLTDKENNCYCFYKETCAFIPDKHLPAQDRICPIPEMAFNERFNIYKDELKYVKKLQLGTAERICTHWAWLIWDEQILMPSLGGMTAVSLAGEGSPLFSLNKNIKYHDKRFTELESKFAGTPESEFRMKLNALAGETWLEQLNRQREINKSSDEKSMADTPPSWLLEASDDKETIDTTAEEINV